MAIDWNKPVETEEENPRPVMVLFAHGGAPVAVMIAYQLGHIHCEKDNPHTMMNGHEVWLRNVAPKPVKRSGFVLVGKNSEGDTIVGSTVLSEGHANGLVGCSHWTGIAHIEWEEVP